MRSLREGLLLTPFPVSGGGQERGHILMTTARSVLRKPSGRTRTRGKPAIAARDPSSECRDPPEGPQPLGRCWRGVPGTRAPGLLTLVPRQAGKEGGECGCRRRPEARCGAPRVGGGPVGRPRSPTRSVSVSVAREGSGFSRCRRQSREPDAGPRGGAVACPLGFAEARFHGFALSSTLLAFLNGFLSGAA